MFDANATVLFNELKFSNSDGSADGRYRSPENPGILGQAAYIRRLSDPRFAVGLGIYVPSGFGTNLHRKAVFDGIQTYRSFNAVGRLLPSVSYLVNDRLSLGASIGIAMAYLELEAPYILQTGALAGLPTLVDLDGKDFAPTATFGVQYDLRQGTVLGLSYTSGTRFDLEGNATVTIPQPGNLPPIKTDFDSKLRVKYPQSAAIGLSHTVNPRHRISADLIWYNWSDAFDSIGLKFKNPNNPALAGLTVTDATPLDWDDSLSIRLGYELDATDTDVLRLGYVHHAGASPNDTLTSYIPAVLEHAFTLGYSHEFRKFEVNASYMYQTGSQRVGTSRLLGQDFSNSELIQIITSCLLA